MQSKISIPKMGMSTVEVDVVSLYVKVGDRVKPGDLIADVESEKAVLSIESEVEGIVTEMLVEMNDTIDVGTVICIVDTD